MELERSWASVVSTSVRVVSIWVLAVWALAIRILSELILLVWLAIRVVILLLRSSIRSALGRSVRACVKAALLSVESAHAKVILWGSAVWTLLWWSAIWICLLRSSVRVLYLTEIGGGDSSAVRLAHRLCSV